MNQDRDKNYSIGTLDLDLRQLFEKVRLIAFDFDGVFTDNLVYVTDNGSESVRCWRGDGLGVAKVHSLGFKTVILSTETNEVVSVRAKKLNIECIQGLSDKSLTLIEYCKECNINLENVAFVGNDINDIGAFKIAGLPIAVHDAHPDVLPFCRFKTKTNGGCGAVREVCDLIFDIHNKRTN